MKIGIAIVHAENFYLQTGSGKTYTMMGDIYEVESQLSEDCGLTPRIFEYLFSRIRMVRMLFLILLKLLSF